MTQVTILKKRSEYNRLSLTPGTDLVCSIVTRINDEKVAYIDRQGSPESEKKIEGKGVRIPPEQIQNLIKCLQDIEKRSKFFGEFAPMDRIEVGPNTDVVVSWKKHHTGNQMVFLNHRSQPGNKNSYNSKGVTFPFDAISWTCEALKEIQPSLKSHE